MKLRIPERLCLFTALVLLACLPAGLLAQRDSSVLLQMQRMGSKDLDTLDPDALITFVRCATRSTENVDNLPFTVWVVTEEDILANGFVTLVDVLKSVPGIRVSQPGNALEGETFMVRGLSGNQYMRILINDVPVKPAGTLGMPIGAQLPIRQAERIEIYFGPASAVWGNEAFAGVVNIILKETERPIFTRAELNFGNNGYNGLDLSFGGKLGRDKNIFRYSIYGSSTVREKTNTFYDKDLYNPEYYTPFGIGAELYRENPNYLPVFPPDGAAPSPIGHESRLFGFAFKWRGLTFNYNRMARFEHTALGLNPVAVSYSNPSNRLGERIETFSLGFERARKRRRAFYTFSAVHYRVDDASTTTLVFDQLSAAAYYVQAPLTAPQDLSQLRRTIFNELASGQRHTVANGLDLRADIHFQTAIFNNIFLDFGGQSNISVAYPVLGYQLRPVDIPIFGESPTGVDKPFAPQTIGSIDANLFAQLQWRYKQFSLTGGTALNFSTDYNLQFAPRLGMLYRLDSTWSIYANAASAFKRPGLYETTNRFRIIEGDSIIELSNPYDYRSKVERMDAAELGIRFRLFWLESTTLGYYQRAFDLNRNGYLIKKSDNTWLYGYAQAPGLSMENWGIQQWFVLRDLETGFSLNKKEKILAFKGEVLLQYTRGKEWFGYGIAPTDAVRNMPGWTAQVRASWRQGKFQLTLSTLRNRGMLSKAVVYESFYGQQRLRDYPRYRTWDVMARLYLSDQFLIYMQVQNLFNQEYAGIDATGTPEDLLYNPQPQRIVRIGVNYNMSDRNRPRAVE
ncbi:MAG: TonB-dependent receptor plug domain-containing protein [Saprospiraceae bacterium]